MKEKKKLLELLSFYWVSLLPGKTINEYNQTTMNTLFMYTSSSMWILHYGFFPQSYSVWICDTPHTLFTISLEYVHSL